MIDKNAETATLPMEPSSSASADNPHSAFCTAPASDSALCTLQASPAPTVIDTAPLPCPAQRRNGHRNGRIASLPRIQRDMVNRMLWNAVPYKNIVEALAEAGYTVTERNISNWATGGYLEWSLTQEHVLQNRLDQDHMVDFLRREDASELPEVGLQAAATRLSQVLLTKLTRAEDPEAHLDNYSKLVDLLLRLNREISATQKHRDDSRRTLGREYDPVLVKDEEEVSAIQNERFYSDPPSDSKLSKPSVPPVLPPLPTGTLMAAQAREEREEEKAAAHKFNDKLWKACLAGTVSDAKRKENSPAPAVGPALSASSGEKDQG